MSKCSDTDRENELILFGMVQGAAVVISRIRQEAKPYNKIKMLPDIANCAEANAKMAVLVFAYEAFHELKLMLKSVSRKDAIDNVLKDMLPIIKELDIARAELMSQSSYEKPTKKSFH